MPEPVLSFEGLTVCFATDSGPVAAVNDVSYQVFPGEVLAVVGESGSGKSVSSRTAMGLLPPTATVRGTVVLGTKAVTKMSERELTALRGGAISMVFQEPGAALDPLFTVGFQIGEALRAHSGMKRKAARAKAIELLRAVGLPDPEARVDYYPHQLSGGQKQRVVIAIAIACEPKVIIADEPTTALDVTVQAEILELLRDLCDRIGAAIVLITHNMGVVADLADRVVVMREGKIVEEAPVDRLFAEPQHEYTRALLAAVPKLHVLPDNWEADEATDSAPVAGAALAKTIVREPIPADAETVLEVSNLVVEFPAPLGRPAFRAVDDVTLNLRRGETLGLVGESGSGKSTIGRCVAALQRPTAGSVRVLGTDIAGLSERNLRPIRRRFGFVFQDPATSLNPRLTIGECVAEPLLVHKEAKGAAARERVRHLLDDVQLPAGVENRYPHELSGGQRQRVSLARALVLRPDLLVADEPTSALDVSVQAKVLELFADLQRECGWACLFISHDLAVVDQLADRIVVLRNGAVVEQGDNDDILRRPREEYTRRLVAAVPVPDPVEQRRRHRYETRQLIS
ncbi:ABC transporter ATP-binding protein [Nocardia seriolae]|uniref:D,D-dipeptide transport ATP-binding protein DdpD n=1 Tax=Nocardia seriolae TaxID=37332 RepID=A0ABC8AMK8_9NOCA|nr:ABC transporter ATP-binding protein [Nocardia seriolae]APA95451.1 putative D,D-dipeptide transport ATP-binding protein DdpD [Nocardia seriolae]OJF78123.1 glutathione ABC transporter ATP-binding protein [Nocardia seriolae]PSK30954.1 ABC transporter ATP-binding protein [Nocardia seriolae]QOW31664.1 ABC transporter ATP-binding protein [Nocardia seriolae]QUN19275.1 ABC transporter ATP-binding protein [Nocardia seriolae]